MTTEQQFPQAFGRSHFPSKNELDGLAETANTPPGARKGPGKGSNLRKQQARGPKAGHPTSKHNPAPGRLQFRVFHGTFVNRRPETEASGKHPRRKFPALQLNAEQFTRLN